MKFIITGNRKAEGSIENSGSKNSAVAIIPLRSSRKATWSCAMFPTFTT